MLGLRRYGYTHMLERTYRNSREYDDVFGGCRAMVFMPPSIRDKRVIFVARNRGIKVSCWLYIWDSAIKDNEFLSVADLYLTRDSDTREDLFRAHRIKPERTVIVGAVQLADLRNTDYQDVGKETRPHDSFRLLFRAPLSY
jgi:hypothetical protein